MHYGAYDFAKIPFIPTIFAPMGTKIGQRDGMSDVRIKFWPLKQNVDDDNFLINTVNRRMLLKSTNATIARHHLVLLTYLTNINISYM